jgi:hypothetical protein
MLELKNWIAKRHFDDKPWLVLGKGPTFSKRGDFDLKSFNKIALNHVVREEKVEVAHIIDIDVADDCRQHLRANCDWLIIPWVPNVKHFRGEYLTLADWCSCIPELKEMDSLGRLVTYDFSHEENGDPWTVVARYFSSEAALGILGRMNVKTVYSLGIDGGRSYSNSFDDLKKRTLLGNGLPSFDLQFERLYEIAKTFAIDYSPLVSRGETDSQRANGEVAGNLSINASSVATTSLLKPTDVQGMSLAAKVQEMEQEIRDLKAAIKNTDKELSVKQELLVHEKERLGWAQNELAEYREHVGELERDMNLLYRSRTWKLGRVFTKPAEILKKSLPSS